MTDRSQLPQTPDELGEFMEGLTFTDEPAALPPSAEGNTMVVRSVRLPLEMDQRVKEVADKRGVKVSVLIRQWVELGLAAAEQDHSISLADAIRALSSLRPLSPDEHRRGSAA